MPVQVSHFERPSLQSWETRSGHGARAPPSAEVHPLQLLQEFANVGKTGLFWHVVVSTSCACVSACSSLSPSLYGCVCMCVCVCARACVCGSERTNIIIHRQLPMPILSELTCVCCRQPLKLHLPPARQRGAEARCRKSRRLRP